MSSPPAEPGTDRVERSEDEWRERLSPEGYRVLREKGTEPAFSGDLLHDRRPGTFVCAGCGRPLFRSDDKYESGSGWPSFTRPADPDAIRTAADHSHGMQRTEVLCARCGGHLGHVFPDGPEPTGQRYCINSVALDVEPDED